MKRILKKIKKFFSFQYMIYINECQEDWDIDSGEIIREAKNPTKLGFFFFEIVNLFIYSKMQTVGRLICKITGKHDWVNEDWAGPDSGGTSGYCLRCPVHFYHPMY